MSIRTLSELFLEAAKHDKPDCLLHKVDGAFVPISTAELVRDVQRLAKALRDLGVARGDRIALMAENGPHWPIVDFASLSVGAVLVPVYPTLTPEQAAYVVNDSGARVAFVHEHARYDGVLGERDDLSQVEHFVLIGEKRTDETTLDELLARGEGADPAAFEAEARKASPDDLATFIYTSGTTGNPKGVMLTHGNITSNVLGSLSMMDIEPSFTALSFLPLSHSFERTVDYIYFYRGVTVAYAESVQAVAQNFGEVKPHVFVSVPRVYEKVQARIYENVAKGSPIAQKIFHWAVGVAKESLPYRVRDESPPGLLGLKVQIADKLVFGKIRERLGGRFEFAMSGGAPLSRDLAAFFWGVGIRIFEGYGLTETSPVITVNAVNKVKLGTVGTVIPDVEVRIAGDGEILARGPNIMRGYYNLPEASAEAIDEEGWFHTGDIGELDDQGFLAITDRKKELIINAYGKNIAPAPIENKLKSSLFIEQAVVIGDNRKFLSGLLVPDFAALEAWAAREGIAAEDRSALCAHAKTRELFAAEVARVNQELARYEQVAKWELVPHEFTIETGELTPTQKIKRRVINSKYGDLIEGIYAAT